MTTTRFDPRNESSSRRYVAKQATITARPLFFVVDTSKGYDVVAGSVYGYDTEDDAWVVADRLEREQYEDEPFTLTDEPGKITKLTGPYSVSHPGPYDPRTEICVTCAEPIQPLGSDRWASTRTGGTACRVGAPPLPLHQPTTTATDPSQNRK